MWEGLQTKADDQEGAEQTKSNTNTNTEPVQDPVWDFCTEIPRVCCVGTLAARREGAGWIFLQAGRGEGHL